MTYSLFYCLAQRFFLKYSPKKHMPSPPLCPYLPPVDIPMNWRNLNHFGKRRDAEFYYTALTYAQSLWLNGYPARSLLAVDRALFANLTDKDEILLKWPLPYAAVPWLINNAGNQHFLGNPRVHYQHLADRVRGSSQEQKKWRSWACWHLVRKCAPDLDADHSHQVIEPSQEETKRQLMQHGIASDLRSWLKALDIIQQ